MQTTISIRLIAVLLIIFCASPAAAQEGVPNVMDMHKTLAQGAANGFLMTLSKPELASTRSFYVLNHSHVDKMLGDLENSVTDYEIVGGRWLNGRVYRTEALLQPSKRLIIIDTGWHDGRWKIEELSLEAVAMPSTSSKGQPAVSLNKGPAPMNNGLSGQIVFQTHSGSDIYLIKADGTGLRKITQGIDPQLSPDGRRIAFTRWEPEYALYTINIDGTNEQRWAAGWRQMKSPSWSADGSRIVFSYQSGGQLADEIVDFNPAKLARNGEKPPRIPDNARDFELENGEISFRIPMDAHWHLQQIDLTTGDYLDTATGTIYSYGSNWHPTDSRKIIFRGDRGLGLYDVNQKVTQRITQDGNDKAAVISPDGSKIALSYWQSGNWEVHGMNIDGSQRQRLTQTPMHEVLKDGRTWNNAAPAWSPDGQQLMFMTDRTGQWEMWIMKVDGSDQRPMFTNGALDDISLQYDGVDERMISWQ